jgi:hypothetical protein
LIVERHMLVRATACIIGKKQQQKAKWKKKEMK